jgi:4-amino-4-deoxy-L-arabinose transferase-like glycosyltransferase
VRHKKQLNWWQGLGILGLIWLAGTIGDRIWLILDRSVPGWDPADYLNGALNYWRALQEPQWLNGEWWRSFWLTSNKIPPLNYILTVPFISLFGTSQDAAFLVMSLHSAILLVSVYGLGVALFNVSVGLWAAGLCQLLPGLYYFRLEFLLDYPLAAIVTFSFWLLTLWNINWQEGESGIARTQTKKEKFIQSNPQSQLKNYKVKSNKKTFNSWLLAILFGISFGLALLLKQTALFFLLFPILWVFFSCLKNRQWLRLTQFITSLVVGILVLFPWYRTNWLLTLTSGKRATIDSAIIEGDPPLNTLPAWTFYGEVLPHLLSWYLLVIAIAGLFLYVFRQKNLSFLSFNKWRWLIVFLVGGYLLSSLNMNKHDRYILPLLPVISIILAVGLLGWRGGWQKYIRWGTVSLALILMLLNIFPLGGDFITAKLSPHYQKYPYMGEKYPHQQVVEEIINTSPYLRSTLGVLPSTVEINQHNFSFYGGQYNFQVVGRQVGVREEEVEQDARSLDWFLTKTGDQGSVPEAQAAIVKIVEEGGDFQLQDSWQLPDNSTLKLYHRLVPTVQVGAIGKSPIQNFLSTTQDQIQLNRVSVPETAPPGVPIPVTYEWSGDWQQLQSGIVLLTWSQEDSNPQSQWLHDHGIAMGALDSSRLESDRETFQVIEQTAMLPDGDILPGDYILTATYLNRDTGETYPISVPPVKITIDPAAEAIPAPELDLVTQLRTIAPNMARGIKGLEPIFAQTTRINQYDAKHDYLPQAELALSYRLQRDNVSQQQKLDWTYAVILSQVLKQDVDGAIATLQQLLQLNDRNPYNYAYLAFVYLYDWQPRLAEQALNAATKINPHIEEVQTLSGIAALMQGKLIRAWHLLQPIINGTAT